MKLSLFIYLQSQYKLYKVRMQSDAGLLIESEISLFEYETISDYSFQLNKSSRLVLASNILKAAAEDFDWIGNFLNIDPAYLF